MIFYIVYNVFLALVALTALAVFVCVIHAYYQDFKETPRIRKPGKLFCYLVAFIIGVGVISAGQFYLKDSDYVQNLHQAWGRFEGKIQTVETDNIAWGEYLKNRATYIWGMYEY